MLRWREEIASGERSGPSIYASLQKLDGPDASWEGSIAIASDDDIDPVLDQLT